MGNFDMVPEGIISEILSRVPTETVLDCKLVSKPWRDIVRQPSFSQMHLNHHDSGKLNLIFYTEYADGWTRDGEPFYSTEYDENLNCFTRTTRINLIRPYVNCNILGSCNGLICCNMFGFQPDCICNPITNEYIFFPETKLECITGFGYSPSTNEYKVVRTYSCRKGTDRFSMVEVYTLGSGLGWRKGGKMDHDIMNKQGVFVNGAIHRVYREGTIVAFDLADEEFREIPSLPCLPRVGNKLPYVELKVLGGFLCACCHHHNALTFDIWALKRNKSNDLIWSKEFSNMDAEPITFTKSGELLCHNKYSHNENVYRYPPKASSSKILVNFGNKFDTGVPHKNTLVSLKALGEEDTKLMYSGERARCNGGKEAVTISAMEDGIQTMLRLREHNLFSDGRENL